MKHSSIRHALLCTLSLVACGDSGDGGSSEPSTSTAATDPPAPTSTPPAGCIECSELVELLTDPCSQGGLGGGGGMMDAPTFCDPGAGNDVIACLMGDCGDACLGALLGGGGGGSTTAEAETPGCETAGDSASGTSTGPGTTTGDAEDGCAACLQQYCSAQLEACA